MTAMSSVFVSRRLRRLALAWQRGPLAWSAAVTGAAVLALLVAAGAIEARREGRFAAHLDAVVARELQLRDVQVEQRLATEPPDFVRRLPDVPATAHVLRTLQRAAGAHGVRMDSLQTEEQPAADSALRRLDVSVTLHAGYPAVIAVLREVLERYPGATLRRLDIVRASQLAPALSMAPVPAGGGAAAIEAEAHATFGFWSRPLGVVRAEGADVEADTPVMASTPSSASAASGPSRRVGGGR